MDYSNSLNFELYEDYVKPAENGLDASLDTLSGLYMLRNLMFEKRGVQNEALENKIKLHEEKLRRSYEEKKF